MLAKICNNLKKIKICNLGVEKGKILKKFVEKKGEKKVDTDE